MGASRGEAAARDSGAARVRVRPDASGEETQRSERPGVGGWLRGVLGDVVSVLAPGECRLCDAPLEGMSRVPVCAVCLRLPKPMRGALCRRCGESLGVESEWEMEMGGSAAEAQLLCELCRRAEPPFVRAVAYGEYADELREMLHLMKYDGVEPLARPLGAMLARAMEELRPEVGDDAVVVPVPLWGRKHRERGFNQTEELAREAMRSPGLAGWRMEREGLVRLRATESQFGLNPRERRQNLKGAFGPGPERAVARVRGRDAVLVDDILTTGATARVCAAVLQAAGARRVFVATLARAQPETVALWDGGLDEST